MGDILYGNGQYGVNFTAGKGGPHYVVGNAIHANTKDGVLLGKDQTVWLINNLITGNGVDLKLGKKDGFGVKRIAPAKKELPEQAVLLHNLVCGNARGEFSGPLLDDLDMGNLTPTGAEGQGVSASAGCNLLTNVYNNLNGVDGQANTADDDFTLAAASPAIDQGVDPRTLGLPQSAVEADFLSDTARPQGVQFDIGAVEQGVHVGGCVLLECYDGPGGTTGVSACQAGTQTCLPGGVFSACTGEVLPETEIPDNSVDENCDGHDAECDPGATVFCYSGPAGTAGVGLCKAGTQTCNPEGLFGACAGEVLPTTEIPDNGIDEDCNGADQTGGGGGLPPDPSTVAPPVEPGVATTVAAATTFLYTGPNPIQTGVAPDTIELRRAAIIRGKVLDKTDAPLSGVTITVLNHPEFGQTLSCAGCHG